MQNRESAERLKRSPTIDAGPEELAAHGADGGDVVRLDVDVVDGSDGGRGAVGVLATGADLLQEFQLPRPRLVIAPDERLERPDDERAKCLPCHIRFGFFFILRIERR